jgi:chemotaxis protein histidine kinase CheA
MDVVKTKITALGGTVHLETHMGTGTKTIIKLPLTLPLSRLFWSMIRSRPLPFQQAKCQRLFVSERAI